MAPATKHDVQYTIIKIVLIGALVAIPVAGWALWGDDIMAWRKNAAAEEKFGAQFLEIFNAGNSIRVNTPGFDKNPPAPKSRRGKALWLNAKLLPRSNRIEYEFSIDPVHGRLPDELRAEAPGEMQTLALVFTRSARNSSLQIVKTVTVNNMPAITATRDYWVEIIDVCLIDMAKKKFLGMKTFQWHPDMDEINRTGDTMPARNHAEVLSWYEGLKAE